MDAHQRSLPTSPVPSPIKSRSPPMNTTKDDNISGMSGLLAERMAEGGGALCNDQNGQCLGSRGNIDASQSGVYTAIAKLASQLDSTVDGSGGNRQEVPLVSIQTEKAALLVKEYGGRTVVFRVPTEADTSESPTDGEQVVGSDDAAKAS
eukprot:CAMPEP_0183785620 /NCGR_PEP_ID=MMETSP0739-20130205/66595_1 /TAXON_ID=385413 /ORGANISM="Thalassiosira miniscula, Strain CCMP1093" /LENGTH=149 /DNA_ID=CAMNT_0026029627 /DNA_START=84 /DNA_END=533 /DNA_ORIENTATION=-